MGKAFQGIGRRSRFRVPDHRCLDRARPPACCGRKGGSDAQAIGRPKRSLASPRPRGGPSTKINAVVDALGNPLRFILTPGQVHDINQAEALIAGFDFDKLIADTGYDSNRFRGVIAATGGEAVMPSNRSRSQAIPYDEDVYKDRNLVERFFNKIKHFRRIATRYEKTALSFAAMLSVVSAIIWLK